MEEGRKRKQRKISFFATSVLLLAIISTTQKVNALNLSEPEVPNLAEIDADYQYNYPIKPEHRHELYWNDYPPNVPRIGSEAEKEAESIIHDMYPGDALWIQIGIPVRQGQCTDRWVDKENCREFLEE